MSALAVARSVLARVAAAAGGGFPDISEVYQRDYWPESPAALEFPKAAAVVPTVYACINRIAQDMASVPPQFYRGLGPAKKLEERKPGNITDLYARANPTITGYELERDRQFSCDINGRGYLYLETFGGRFTESFELWNMPGHLVRPVAGPRRTIARYHWGLLGSGVDLDPANVIAFNYPNPDWDPLEPAPVGLSPLEAARLAYETRYAMASWQRTFYAKGGNVSHIFSIKDPAGVTPKDKKAMADDLVAQQSIKRAFNPILTQGLDILRVGLSQTEMRYLEAAAMSDADICRVYGIPPVLMGIKEGGGLSDAGATTDLLIYWEQCIRPRVMLRDAVLTERLCPLFGRDLYCETDLSRVLPIQAAMLEQSKAAVLIAGRPILTANEARERLNIEKSDDPTADELPVPFNLVFGSDVRVPQPAAPAPAPAPPAQPSAASASRMRLSGARRETLRRRADADLARYERRVADLFRGVFADQEIAAVARLHDQARASGMDVEAMRLALDPEALLDDDEADLRALSRIYRALIAERGEAAAAEIGEQLTLDVSNSKIADFIQRHAQRGLMLTSETTKAALRQSLSDGTSAGESFSQLVARVRAVFADRKANAATIARTETQPAYNFAALEAWRAAGIQHKEWLAVGDEATRDAHMEADGQQVAIDDVFMVDNERLLYPGDPSGRPGNVINCRCIAQPVFQSADQMSRYFASAPAPHRNGHARPANRIAELVAR